MKILRPDPLEQARAEYEEKFLSLRSVKYNASRDALHLTLSSGITLSIPRSQIGELTNATRVQLAALYPGFGGEAISLDALDVDISVAGLLDELFGRTIRVDLGRRAGKVTTLAKARAARKNGRKGGRPKKRTA